jgi:flavin-dependent dehydrogenase
MGGWDVIVIGGGPAGATAGRLLAQWGHRVTILTRAQVASRALAECLPPSTRKLFTYLEIQDVIDSAGFYRTTGNTVWWSDGAQRVEFYPDGFGYQVPRNGFDRLLLDQAWTAGAEVQTGTATVGPTGAIVFNGRQLHARFVLDCSGRAGLLGRAWREKRPRAAAIALCGIWRNEAKWDLPDPSHTLVELYENGWAWSVPVEPSVRYVAFMTDRRRPYLGELAKTRAFREIFSGGTLQPPTWGRDAAVYWSRRVAGPGFLIVGDAAATLDPLSSFGVKKAIASGWVAAVVANTCLRRPDMEAEALRFFEEREREVFETYDRLSGTWYGDEAPSPELRVALQELRAQPSIHLKIAPGVVSGPRPAIEGREIVMRDSIGGIDFLANVNAPRLAELAPQFTQVPDLYEAYNRACTPVALPDFLTALSTLVAKGILK